MIYYPYLRGKQFDLKALQLASEQNILNNQIIPIIEPVKDSTALQKTVKTLLDHDQALIVIDNPQVSTYHLATNHLHPISEFNTDPNFHRGHILTNEDVLAGLSNLSHQPDYLFTPRFYDLKALMTHTHATLPGPVLISNEARSRQLIAPEQRITLQDHFTWYPHVADYGHFTDEFYSTDLYDQLDAGETGFADYQITGKFYHDKGGPQRALALHLTYLADPQTIKIHHYVSDSNDSAKDPQRKFFEALTKLANDPRLGTDQLPMTFGIKQLFDYQTTKKFPGNGMLKTLTLLHHLEIMNIWLHQSL